MEIRTVGSFLDYYRKIHQRTAKVVLCIPREKLDWTLTMADVGFLCSTHYLIHDRERLGGLLRYYHREVA